MLNFAADVQMKELKFNYVEDKNKNSKKWSEFNLDMMSTDLTKSVRALSKEWEGRSGVALAVPRQGISRFIIIEGNRSHKVSIVKHVVVLPSSCSWKVNGKMNQAACEPMPPKEPRTEQPKPTLA